MLCTTSLFGKIQRPIGPGGGQQLVAFSLAIMGSLDYIPRSLANPAQGCLATREIVSARANSDPPTSTFLWMSDACPGLYLPPSFASAAWFA